VSDTEDLTGTTWTVGTVTGRCGVPEFDCWVVNNDGRFHYYRGDLGKRVPDRAILDAATEVAS